MTPEPKSLRLQSIHIRNFKAIVDSRAVKLGPLTVFIGHNGSGKSSLIEALETYQAIVTDGLDSAMQRWLGIEHARHKGVEAKERAGQPVNPIAFDLSIGVSPRKSTRIKMQVNNDAASNRMYVEFENVTGASGRPRPIISRRPETGATTTKWMRFGYSVRQPSICPVCAGRRASRVSSQSCWPAEARTLRTSELHRPYPRGMDRGFTNPENYM